MDSKTFNAQVDRLKSVYGEKNYTNERTKIIWLEVGSFSDEFIEKTVNYFIGCMRTPPLLPEFREAATKERERLYLIEKEKKRRDAIELFNKNINGDDASLITKTIIKRLNGQVSDVEHASFVETLKRLAEFKTGEAVCTRCGDGLIFEEKPTGLFVSKCNCLLGRNRPEALPTSGCLYDRSAGPLARYAK